MFLLRKYTHRLHNTLLPIKESMTKSSCTSLHTARRANELECGVDEVARGCLFGRVYAGAVVFQPPSSNAQASDPVPVCPELPKGIVIRDSKTMSRAQREQAAQWIHEHAYAVSVSYKDETYIDEHNILQSAQDAMGDAVRAVQTIVKTKAADDDTSMPNRIDRLLVDGQVFKPNPSVGIPPLCVVKGDSIYLSIACAAIVAKVAHDAYVQRLCDSYPNLALWYDLRKNVGYGTVKHRKGLQTHGVTPFHRKTFSGCSDVGLAIGWDTAPDTHDDGQHTVHDKNDMVQNESISTDNKKI